LRGLLFDLDDTLLSHGVLTRAAYSALWDLRDAGLALAAVTGRPSAWGKVIARQWPVAGCVTENGNVLVVRRGSAVECRATCTPSERRERQTRLARLVEQVKRVVPDARLTDDASLRQSDVTWDIGEHVRLPEDRVQAIAREVARFGARWSRSSVHLHATFDVDDKATGALRFCATGLGQPLGACVSTFGFVGDSANDAACFAGFRTTFGVANVRPAIGQMSVPPRYVAARPMGEGFAEIAAAIIEARRPVSTLAC